MDLYNNLELEAKKDGVEKIVVGAIITNCNGDVFIAKRKKNDFMGSYYEIPGGHVEQSETIYEALVREIKEETNLDVESVISYINYFDYFSSSGRKTRQYNFVVKVKSINNIILTEHDCYKWLSINNLTRTGKMSKEVKETLMFYKLYINKH